MARMLLDDAEVESHDSGKMGGLAGGAWLGIGIAIGFVIGVFTYAMIACYLRRRKSLTPNSQVRPQRAGAGEFSSLANDLRSSANNPAAPPPPPAKQSSSENMFFSPLQSSMAKATNMRGSANMAALPDPAMYGSHGIALLQVQGPTTGAALPQPETDAEAAPASIPPTTPFNAAPTADGLVSHPSGRDTADQGLQTRQAHQRMFSVADAYGAEDLDDEWAVVLGDLDGLLSKKGQPGLASPERAVAVRRLIAVTGSRGMQHALEAAMQDVLRYRAKQQ